MRHVYKAIKKEVRDNIRRRYHWTCQGCGRVFSAAERHLLTVHHIDKKPYCRKCHDEVEAPILRARANPLRWYYGR